jgi:hypothetical protein
MSSAMGSAPRCGTAYSSFSEPGGARRGFRHIFILRSESQVLAGMHMGSCFVLLTAAPGHERDLLDRLADVPGVVARSWLFGSQIALQLDEAQLAAAPRLAALAGVREARVYHDHDAWVVKQGKAGPNT